MTPKKNNQEYDEEIEIDNLKENKAAEADTEDNEPIEVVKASAKSIQQLWAIISQRITPGTMGLPGKCPSQKKGFSGTV